MVQRVAETRPAGATATPAPSSDRQEELPPLDVAAAGRKCPADKSWCVDPECAKECMAIYKG